VAWGDYDNDGRLDFLITGAGVSQLWRNMDSGFTNVPIPGLPGVSFSSVAWGDYDNDGQLDFLLTGTTNGSVSGVISQLWRNTGSGFSKTSIALPGVYFSSVAWGDYDNDGRLDFLLTGATNLAPGGAFSQLWRNSLPLSNAPPAAPAALAATTSGDALILHWSPPVDDHTPSPGLNYNVRIGSAPGAADVLSPMALTGGLRLVPALGNTQTRTNARYQLPPGQTYYWSVQALDTSFAASPFAAEQQFTLAPLLVNPGRLPNGAFEFHFTNQTALNFEVFVTTNLALPSASWTSLGPATPLGGGYFRFTDPAAVGQEQRYFLLRAQ
jgi:hypothetical protein